MKFVTEKAIMQYFWLIKNNLMVITKFISFSGASCQQDEFFARDIIYCAVFLVDKK